MSATQAANPFTMAFSLAAVLVPVLYFGVQIGAAPFYAGYDFLTQAASDLGSERSSLPVVFNVGAILSGVAALVAAGGFGFVLARLRVHWVWIGLTMLALIAVGLGNVWAGVYPLPDPRHAMNPFTPGFLLLPAFLLMAVWGIPNAGGWRVYLMLNVVVLVALTVARGFNLDIRAFEGVFQRVLALVVFVPIGAVGWFLFKSVEARA